MNTETLQNLCANTESRFPLWAEFLRSTNAGSVAEIGVYRGAFAAKILAECDSIQKYYMIDPWRHLDDWNKPANTDDDEFQRFMEESEAVTAFASQRRVMLRGTTTEVIDRIPDGSLDFAYVDGDHTLRGVTIDLTQVWPKVRDGGWIGGDDFAHTVWQHGDRFEPTLVFPYAVYFAEASKAKIYALPHQQFLIHKSNDGFEFVDLTNSYPDTTLQNQFRLGRVVKNWWRDTKDTVKTQKAERAKK